MKPGPVSGLSRAAGAGAWFYASAALIVAALALLPYLLRIPYRFAINYNEGWNAYFAELARQGGALYPAGLEWVGNNYPPLSFHLVGLIGELSGDVLITGRWVAFASLLVVAVNLGRILLRAGVDKPVAVASAALMAAVFGVYSANYVGMNDPQFLAHALMTSAMVMVFPGRDIPLRTLAAAAVLMVLAGLVKHNLLAFPLAYALMLALNRDRRVLVFCLAGGVAAVSGLGLAVLVYGEAFFTNVRMPREFTPYGVFDAARNTLPQLAGVWLPVLVLAVMGRLADAAGRLTLTYAGVALALGLIFSGGAGTSFNVFFDFLIACVLALGLATRPRVGSPVAARIALAVAWAALMAAWPAGSLNIAALQADYAARERDASAAIRVLAAARAPVVCTMPALCYWAGHAFEYDHYHIQQLFIAGQRDPERFYGRVANAGFGAVQLRARPAANPHEIRLEALLEAQYAQVVDNRAGKVWIPRIPTR